MSGQRMNPTLDIVPADFFDLVIIDGDNTRGGTGRVDGEVWNTFFCGTN